MATYDVDTQKISRMVHDTLNSFSNSGAHPAEVVLALSECVGRVIMSFPDSDIVKKEMVDIAIKHMAASIEAGRSQIIQ